MSEGSDRKTQLGRVQLQRKPVSGNDDLGDWSTLVAEIDREEQGVEVRADEVPAELAEAVEDQAGVPAVDLRKVSIAASALALVSRELACERLLLPLYADRERMFVAVADLNDRQAIEELAFTSGLTVLAYAAAHGMLRDVIEAAYAAYVAGAPGYYGPLTKEGQSRRATIDLEAVSKPPNSRTFPENELSRPLAKLTPDELHLDAGDSLAPPAETQQRMPRLLVVDDSDDIRRLLTRVFQERDYEVAEASTGMEALECLRASTPDLVLLDAMLPGGMHGFDLCRRIRGSRRYGHLPIVMLSAVYRGWRFSEDLRRSYGVNAFIEKPFRIGEVVAAVERGCAGAGRSQPPDDTGEGLAGEQLKAGIEAYAQGDLEAAVEHLKRGIQIDPLAFRLHYHLGLLYGKQENVFEAIHELEAAADLRPRDFSTLKNLAVLYQRAGFKLKATEMWERALGCAPDDATRASIRNHLVSLL